MKIVGRIFSGSVILVVVLFAIWRVSLFASNRSRLKTIASRGEPVDSVALDRSYAAVSDAENAALVWLRGCAEMAPRPKDAPALTGFQFPRKGMPSTEEHLPYARSLVFSNRAAFATFRRAAALSKSRYPVDLSPGLVAQLPHLSKLKSAAHLLSMEAFVAGYDGQPERAVEAVLGNIAVARSVVSEPVLVSQLARAYLDTVAFNSAGYVLNYVALTDGQLETLGRAFAASEDPESLARAYMGERASVVTIVNRPELMAPGLPAPGDEDNAVAELPKNMRSPFIRATGFFQRDLALFVDAMTTNIACARLPDPQRFHAQTNSDRTIEKAQNGYYILSSLLLPAMAHAPTRDVAHRAGLRIAQIALAVERYRLASDNKIPSDLSVLVPKYLPAIPIDPFDGQPIRFKRTETGYIVYSVGKDGKDDGGTEWRRGLPRHAPEDITFIVERPEKR